MNSETDALIILVKSLTREERKFIGKWLRRWRKDSHVSHLFASLLKCCDSDKNGIELFKKQNPEVNITVTKRLLFSRIMEGLAHLYKSQHREERFLNDLIQASILIEKGLFVHAQEIINIIIEKAIKLGYHGIAIHCFHLLLRLSRRWQNPDFSFLNFMTYEKAIVEDWNLWFSYAIRFERILRHFRFKGGHFANHKQQSMELPSEANSILTRYLFIQNMLINKGLHGQYMEGIEMAYDLLEEVLENEETRKLVGHLIASLIVNLIIHLTEENNFTEAEKLLAKLHDLVKKGGTGSTYYEILKNFIMAHLYFSEMTGKEFLTSNFEELVLTLKVHMSYISWDFAYIYFTLAKIYFYDKQWDSTLKWLEPFLKHGKGNKLRSLYSDIAGFAYLLAGIASYELGKIDDLNHYIRRSKYHLKKQPFFDDNLNNLLNIIGRLSYHTFSPKDISSLNELLDASDKMKMVARYVDLRRWLNSHKNNKI